MLICSPELPILVLGLLFLEGGYILLYVGAPTFWQRRLCDSCFQNPFLRAQRHLVLCYTLLNAEINRVFSGNNVILDTVKPVLSGHSNIDKTKILMTNGSLMKVESICRMLPLGAFCNTFDLH